MNYQELEIKILNVDENKIREKLEKIGATYIEERVQKIYTYDCYEPLHMYKLAVADFKITHSRNSVMKIKNMLTYIAPILTKEDYKVFKEVTKKDTLEEYLDGENVDAEILLNEKILDRIEKTKDRFFKWLRLRQDNEKVELTMKYIYSTEAEYEIDKVKEVEILVNDFETANKLVEEMGYYRKKLVEKRRVTYKYKDMDIEIDTWPLIETYVEIEGKDVEEIYNVARELGYAKEETKVMNTEDVYLEKGIDLNDFEVLTFDKQIKR